MSPIMLMAARDYPGAFTAGDSLYFLRNMFMSSEHAPEPHPD